MSTGFIPDYTYAAALVAGWYPGPPQRNFWTTTKIERNTAKPISAMRCDSCGFLELYAK
jgi:hypothetical protein